MSEKRKKYSKEFKMEALKLAEKTGNLSKVASDLGIRPNMLYLWKKELELRPEKAFPGNGNPIEKELHDLRKDKARLEEEVEILKKASGIFLRLSREDTKR